MRASAPQATEVAEDVFAYLQPPGGWGQANGGLIAGREASLLVETLTDLGHTRSMLDALRASKPSAGEIGTVVNTHSDPDHCWGNQLLAGQAEIIATRAAAEAMLELDPALMQGVKEGTPRGTPQGDFAEVMFGAYDFSDVVVTPPTRVFEGSLIVSVEDRRIELTQVGPAHTVGDLLLHVPDARVVFTGDIVFSQAHPMMWDGPVERWIKACDQIIALAPTVVVPGHGPLCDLGTVRDVREYLSYVLAEASQRHAAGLTALEAAYDIDLSAYAGWIDEERIVAAVDSVFRELAGSNAPPDRPGLIAKMADYRARR